MEDFIHRSKINLYPTRCNLCGGRVVYTTNDHIYGKKYGSGYCYLCTKCGAYVGTHIPRPREAFGILANSEMRNAKKICHDFFDNNFWRGKNKSRTKRLNAYAEMAELLNIPVSECHFGYFDLPMLRKAYKAMLEMKKKRDLNRIKCAKKTANRY